MENKKLVSVPEGLTNYLYSAGIISFLLCMGNYKLQSTDMSPLEKTSIVLDEVERNMSGTDTMKKFNMLCEILEKMVVEQ